MKYPPLYGGIFIKNDVENYLNYVLTGAIILVLSRQLKPPSDEGGGKTLVLTEGEKVKTYNRANIPIAKILRKSMTPWERKLWYQFLRNYPIRFQRQKPIGNYIVDFYCAKAKLVLELDGSGHYTNKQIEEDNIRTKELESMSLTVLRISNLDVDSNFHGVCEFIDLAVKKSLPQSASLTAPSSEGAKR